MSLFESPREGCSIAQQHCTERIHPRHNEPSKYDLAVAQWLKLPTGVREVMGTSIPSETQIFSLSPVHEKLNIPSFFMYPSFPQAKVAGVCFR